MLQPTVQFLTVLWLQYVNYATNINILTNVNFSQSVINILQTEI